MPQNEQARLYRVRGRVQGVGFRYFVERAAARLGLTGYAKNLDDGSVEVYAVGAAHTLAELENLLWKGPAYSEVRGVDAQPAAVQRLAGFRIEPSW